MNNAIQCKGYLSVESVVDLDYNYQAITQADGIWPLSPLIIQSTQTFSSNWHAQSFHSSRRVVGILCCRSCVKILFLAKAELVVWARGNSFFSFFPPPPTDDLQQELCCFPSRYFSLFGVTDEKSKHSVTIHTKGFFVLASVYRDSVILCLLGRLESFIPLKACLLPTPTQTTVGPLAWHCSLWLWRIGCY